MHDIASKYQMENIPIDNTEFSCSWLTIDAACDDVKNIIREQQEEILIC